MHFKRNSLFRKTFALALLALGISIGGQAQYCTSNLYTTGCIDDDYIQSFSTSGGSTNITNNGTGCSNSTTGYTYFSGQTHTATGSTVNFSLTITIEFDEFVYMWVDWNSDFDFNDPGEQVYTAALFAAQTVTSSFTIPTGTTAGTKRLRVRCVYDTLATVTACTEEEYGEMEDYNLVVQTTTSPCAAPTGLAASSVTPNAATLSWTAPSGATGYEYVLNQVATSPTGAGTLTTGTTYPASGLTPSTTYYFHLRTRCGTTTFSPWTSVSFTTGAVTPTCIAPTNLTASSITSTSATLFWTAVAGASGYQYILDQISSNPTGAGAAISSTSFPTGGLTPTTTYYFHLRTQCGTTFSPWTVVSFTTTSSNPGCNLPTALTVTNTNATTANLSWPAVSGATGYQYANTTSPAPPASGTLVTTTSATINGLTTGTVYYAHVRTRCGTNTFSSWRTTQYTKATTSIAATSGGSDFTLIALPNPAGDVLKVQVDGISTNHTALLSLTDVSGRVLRQVIATGKETLLDLTGIPTGIYLLRYAGSEHSSVLRIQKL